MVKDQPGEVLRMLPNAYTTLDTLSGRCLTTHKKVFRNVRFKTQKWEKKVKMGQFSHPIIIISTKMTELRLK